MRRNFVEYSVTGIGIENYTFADVYENWAAYNTSGILVFDLPNLMVKGGCNTRFFDNVGFNNTKKNFAPPGNIVGMVPSGSGIMVLANDAIEVFNNLIRNHPTAAISIASYLITEIKITDSTYDAYPEAIYIHNE